MHGIAELGGIPELSEFPAVMRKSEAVAPGDPVMPVFDGLDG
jgi:hypothetical protein